MRGLWAGVEGSHIDDVSAVIDGITLITRSLSYYERPLQTWSPGVNVLWGDSTLA